MAVAKKHARATRELPSDLLALVGRVSALTGQPVEAYLREAERMPLDEFEDALIARERIHRPKRRLLTRDEATDILGF